MTVLAYLYIDTHSEFCPHQRIKKVLSMDLPDDQWASGVPVPLRDGGAAESEQLGHTWHLHKGNQREHVVSDQAQVS